MTPSAATVLRTLRHLRPSQAWHQAAHLLRGTPRPAPEPSVAPQRAAGAPPAAFLPAPAHARFEAPGRVELLNRPVDFAGPIDWEFAREGPLFAFHLHQHDFLRADGVTGEQRAAVLSDWIARHRSGTGWHPAPISLRALTWLKLLLTPQALPDAASARVEASLAAQLDTLRRGLELRLLANHYLSNLLALVGCGVAFRGAAAEGWLAHVGRLRAELAEQIRPDGAHVERSPMYHALLLENVLDVLNVVRATPARAPAGLDEALGDAAARMLGALRVYTHPDGEIALFGDSARGIAHAPAVLEGYGRALGVDSRGPDRPGLLDCVGFARLEAGGFSLLASLAGPMPAYQPGHAHADALAFELCLDGTRVVADTGVCEYVPGPRRDRARATASHATVEVGGRDQAELWAQHRVGGRPRVSLARFERGRLLEGTCAGWATPDSVHRRTIEASEAGVSIRDVVEGPGRSLRLILPLAPGLEPELVGGSARLDVAGRALAIDLPANARWTRTRLDHYPEFGRCVERAALVGEAEGPGPFAWRFSRA